MSETDLCRLCAVFADEANSQKLFERNQRKLLRQIEKLVGFRLKNTKDLPQHICKPCEEQTQQAHQFRERCIRVQHDFATAQKITKKKHKLKEEEEAPPIEEVVLNETKLVKVEEGDYEDDDGDGDVPMQPHNLDLLLKHEQTNNGDSSNDGFNHLADDYHNSAPPDEEEESQEFRDSFTLNIDADAPPSTTTAGREAQCDVAQKPPIEMQFDAVEEDEQESFLAVKQKKNESKMPKKRKNACDKQKIYICDQCGNHFTLRQHFLIHLQRHTGNKQYQCEICSNKFFTPSELRRHMRRHTGEKPFPCRQCERRFGDYSTRVKHERTHTNERPFICQQCGKTFTTTYILRNHMLTHTGERSFKCDLCNKSFQRQTHLVTHRRSIMHKQNAEKQLSAAQDMQLAF